MSTKTILIVDDHADNRTVYGWFLEAFGFTVLEATNGHEAVVRAREVHPDLILMDISMPVMDGLQATQMLKVDQDTANIPVIVVTAHEGAEIQGKAYRSGCDAFLCKPVEPRRILQEVNRFLDGGAKQTA